VSAARAHEILELCGAQLLLRELSALSRDAVIRFGYLPALPTHCGNERFLGLMAGGIQTSGDLPAAKAIRGYVFWRDNLVGVYQGSTKLSSRVTEGHLQSRGFGVTKRLR
jgi:hypothetical protein